jgi:hypothetical protein
VRVVGALLGAAVVGRLVVGTFVVGAGVGARVVGALLGAAVAALLGALLGAGLVGSVRLLVVLCSRLRTRWSWSALAGCETASARATVASAIAARTSSAAARIALAVHHTNPLASWPLRSCRVTGSLAGLQARRLARSPRLLHHAAAVSAAAQPRSRVRLRLCRRGPCARYGGGGGRPESGYSPRPTLFPTGDGDGLCRGFGCLLSQELKSSRRCKLALLERCLRSSCACPQITRFSQKARRFFPWDATHYFSEKLAASRKKLREARRFSQKF